jgi:ankyrin repeat protein
VDAQHQASDITHIQTVGKTQFRGAREEERHYNNRRLELSILAHTCSTESRYLLSYFYDNPLHLIHLLLGSITMPPRQLPLELLLMTARLLTDDDGELCLADFNSFLRINRALYACLNRTLWQEAVKSESITARVFAHSIHTNDLARLKFFLELGANIETQITVGYVYGTPLNVAARLDYVPLAHLLLEHGATLVQHDSDDRPRYSAIHVARSAEMVQLLLDHHADPEQECFGGDGWYMPLHYYAHHDDCIEAMRLVLRNGAAADPTSSNPHRAPSNTPLHIAAVNSINAVKLLLEHGADAKKRSYDEPWETPLHFAVQAGKFDVVTLLLEHWPEGARERDGDGKTPLHVAASWGKIDMVALLLELWPEGIREKHYYGKTLLHLAAERGNTDVVRLLLELWPEGQREKDEHWNTPLHLAALDSAQMLSNDLFRGAEGIRLLVESWPEGKEEVNKAGYTPLSLFKRNLYPGVERLSQTKEMFVLLGGV